MLQIVVILKMLIISKKILTCFIAASAICFYSAGAHDGVPVNNDELGVPGFPDCVQTATGDVMPKATRTLRQNTEVEGDYYQGRHSTNMELDPAMTLDCYQRNSTTTNPQPIRIGCVGDSITAGACSSDKLHTYPSVLQTLLGEDHFAVTNLGACGSTMLQHGDSPYWERPQFKTLTSNTWDIIIIMLGTNDAKDTGHGGPANWPHNCTGDSALECPFAQDYLKMIDLVQTLGPNKAQPPDVYIMVPPPVMRSNQYGMNATVINHVFPALVPKIAKWAGLLTNPIDIFSAFGGSPSVDRCTEATIDTGHCSWWCDRQSCDQCHPNNVGYHHMAKTVQLALGL